AGPATQMGPVVNDSQLEQDLAYVDIAVKEGGRLVTGGTRLELGKPGFYMSPALIADTTLDMRINREEVFGPVVSIVKIADYEEGVGMSNAGRCGQLARGVRGTRVR